MSDVMSNPVPKTLYQPERIYEPREIKGGRVIVLGMGLSIHQWFLHLYENPAVRSDSEVWTVNWGGLGFNYDVLFNSHNFFDQAYGENVRNMYRSLDPTKPLVTLFAQPDMPASYSFPYQLVVDKFNTNYLENSVAYMVAYACLCHVSGHPVKSIHLFGCDYNYLLPGMGNMYELGRACVEFWIGIAHQLGIEVGAATNSMLLDTQKRKQVGSYGYHGWEPDFTVTRGEDDVEKLTCNGFRDPRVEDAVMNKLIEDQANASKE